MLVVTLQPSGPNSRKKTALKPNCRPDSAVAIVDVRRGESEWDDSCWLGFVLGGHCCRLQAAVCYRNVPFVQQVSGHGIQTEATCVPSRGCKLMNKMEGGAEALIDRFGDLFDGNFSRFALRQSRQRKPARAL
jgi:hypothetical protein